MTKTSMKATTVRRLMSTLLVLTVIAAGAGFYFGLEQVRSYAVDVSHTSADANAGDKNIENLRALKQALTNSGTLVTKANKLFATNNNYQSQAVIDVQRYAKIAGITVSNTSFEDPKSGSDSTDPTMIIKLKSPLAYAKLLRFLDAVEGNLPKMQITGISLSRPTSGADGQVEADEVTIRISTR